MTVFGTATGCCGQVAHAGGSDGCTDVLTHRVMPWGLGDAPPIAGPRPGEKSQPRGSSLAGQEENSAGNQGFHAVPAAPEELCSGHPGLRNPPSPRGEAAFASSLGRPGAAVPGAAEMSAAKELPGFSKHWHLNKLQERELVSAGEPWEAGEPAGPRGRPGDADGCSSAVERDRQGPTARLESLQTSWCYTQAAW